MPNQAERRSAPPCFYCQSASVYRHGYFRLKDSSLRQRFRCRACGRSFHPFTGTPTNYIKKRREWERHHSLMVQGLSLRRTAALLCVQLATAFRWRHRLLAVVCRQPQTALWGRVGLFEAYVRYSEKGSRTTNGPGAFGIRSGRPRVHREGTHFPPRKPFRRFIDGKPSCVLLLRSVERSAVVLPSRGRPGPDALETHLSTILAEDSELWTADPIRFTEVCRRLGVRHRNILERLGSGEFAFPRRDVVRLGSYLYAWLRRFRGVATRYIENYVGWFRMAAWPVYLKETETASAALRSAATFRMPIIAA
jgi:transposase-like protein